MKRLFTFGCSFTQYQWPTWADILGKEFDYFENWGRHGSGNQYIFNSLVECNQRNKFTSEDTVVIMWSTTAREDRYIKDQGGWTGTGNIYFSPIFTNLQKKTLLCERGFVIRDLALISAAKDLLEHYQVRYKMSSIMPFDIDQDIQKIYTLTINCLLPNMNDVLLKNSKKRFQDFFTIGKTPSKQDIQLLKDSYNLCKGSSWPNFDIFLKGQYIDPKIKQDIENNHLYDFLFLISHQYADHPSPKEHLIYVQKIFNDFVIKNDTINWIENYKFGDKFQSNVPTQRL